MRRVPRSSVRSTRSISSPTCRRTEKKFLADNAAFFYEVLPGRDAPIGNPGSSSDLGPVGVDTPMVAALPQNQQAAPAHA